MRELERTTTENATMTSLGAMDRCSKVRLSIMSCDVAEIACRIRSKRFYAHKN